MSKKNILISGPALSLSGYGQQTRFAIEALKEYSDHNIFINCTDWGNTAWITEETEESKWIDQKIEETRLYANQGGQFDLSIQVTIPNEIERQAPLNICYTAGIEVDKISPQWIQKVNEVSDKVIVVSEWAKTIFDNTSYDLKNEQGQVVRPNFACEIPVEAVRFPYKEINNPKNLSLDLKHDFNFLSVFQWIPRKNADNLVRWFVEEFYDREVGLVLKANHVNNSLFDYNRTRTRLEKILSDYEDRKCSVHLLHGGLDKDEMLSLYHQDEIKGYLSTTHGECFGLPLFESACAGLPVIATDWSGQTDYLYKGDKPLFSNVPYSMKEISEEAEWPGVLDKGTKWASVKQGPFKMAMRDMVKNHRQHRRRAQVLQDHLKEEFSETHKGFVESVNDTLGIETYKIEYPEQEDYDGISFCISTNGERPEKIKTEISSIHDTMKNSDKNYEVIVGGDVSDLELDNVVKIKRPEIANTGKIAALRNEVGNEAKYDIIVFADDDIIFTEDWSTRLEEFTSETGWNVLGHKILLPDEGRYWDKATYKPHKMIDYDESSGREYRTSCLMIIRKDVFDNHKWDNSIEFYAERKGGEVNEDVEYSQRLQDEGYYLIFDKENLAWHNDKGYIDIGELCVDREDYCNNLGLDVEDFEMEESEKFKKRVEELKDE